MRHYTKLIVKVYRVKLEKRVEESEFIVWVNVCESVFCLGGYYTEA
jgi:hypothetical protein